MIKLNSKEKSAYTLVLATEADLQDEVIKLSKEAGVLNQKNNTFYLKVNDKREDVRKELTKQLQAFVAKNAFNVNVDIDSFVKGLSNKDTFGEEKVFNTIVETIALASHKPFTMKKVDEKKADTETEYNLMTSSTTLEAMFEKEMIKAEYTNYARDLQDMPPNIATSEWIADKMAKDGKAIPNVKVSVYGLKEIQKMNMGLLLSVNAGSHVEPRVVVVEYNSDSTLPKTVLVGKGITFDSGGYNLKPSQAMKGMKMDMSGAAIMVSTVFALAKAGAKANVAAVGMLTDNRIGGHATLTESIIKSMNGLTVQIDNTDAEGRLVLGDGLTYAVRELNADRIIDAATLTGAMLYSLGAFATGAFTKNDNLWKDFKAASEYSGERAWRLPVFEEHSDIMKDSPIADLTNTGSPAMGAGSSTAAAFLNEFVEGKPFLHLDIAAMDSVAGRGTGVMVRTLFDLLNK